MTIQLDKIPKMYGGANWSGILPATHPSCLPSKIKYSVTMTPVDDFETAGIHLLKVRVVATGLDNRELWSVNFTQKTISAGHQRVEYMSRIRELSELPYDRLKDVEVAMQILCGRSPDPEDARY